MPDFRGYVREHLPHLGVSGAREAEIIEELSQDLEQHFHHALASGLSEEDAWREVENQARSWGELGLELRSAFGERPLPPPGSFSRVADQLARELRYAVRQLWHSLGFSVVAILMLALGIGANTAIFSLLNAILLRQLPVRQPAQLYLFGKAEASGTTAFVPHRSTQVFSYPFFKDFRRNDQVFSDVAAVQSFLVESHGRVGGEASMEPLKLELVSGNYFQVLGVAPSLGRVFADADDRAPGANPIAVANYSWWRSRMAGNPAIAGNTVTIGSTVYTVVGVGPPGFFGVTVGSAPDLWIPLTMQAQISPDKNGLDRNMFQSLHLIGRLKPGVNLQQAQTATNFLFRRIVRGYLGPAPPQDELDGLQKATVDLTPASTGRSHLRREFVSPLYILMGIVAIVLLIACANIANLMLTRATARQREIAIRMSVGADRSRLIRQLLVESALLALVGAVFGVAFAWGASRLLLAMVSSGAETVPIRVTPDATVLAFTIALTVLTVFLFGMAPAWRATAFDLATTLKVGRGVSAGRNRLARGLVVGQVAMSLMLLAGAGLFLRSLANLSAIDVGFDRHNVLRLRIDPAAAGYQRDARLTSLMQRIERSVSNLSGVQAASFALNVFDGGGWSEDDLWIPGHARSETEVRTVLNIVGPGYFDVMRTPIVLGRAPSLRDNMASPKIAVINETMARTHFPGGSPLGRIFNVGDSSEWQNVEVVGVAKDSLYMEVEEKQMPAVFFSHAQDSSRFLANLVVRYTGDSGPITMAIRGAISQIDRNLPVGDVRTLAGMVDDFAQNRRLVAQLSTFFGILAASLACIGIYGVMSYGVARRTNEFGIRMALGAKGSDVLWVVLRETLFLTLVGVVFGVALTLASGSLVRSLLFGLEPTNPLIMVVAVGAMIIVALIAGYLPARRAIHIDPVVALRDE